MKKKSTKKKLSFLLPEELVRFYERVAKAAGVTRSQAMLVIIAARILDFKGKKK